MFKNKITINASVIALLILNGTHGVAQLLNDEYMRDNDCSTRLDAIDENF